MVFSSNLGIFFCNGCSHFGWNLIVKVPVIIKELSHTLHFFIENKTKFEQPLQSGKKLVFTPYKRARAVKCEYYHFESTAYTCHVQQHSLFQKMCCSNLSNQTETSEAHSTNRFYAPAGMNLQHRSGWINIQNRTNCCRTKHVSVFNICRQGAGA